MPSIWFINLFSFTAAPEHEKKAIEWVQWLVKEEAYFERYVSSHHTHILF